MVAITASTQSPPAASTSAPTCAALPDCAATMPPLELTAGLRIGWVLENWSRIGWLSVSGGWRWLGCYRRLRLVPPGILARHVLRYFSGKRRRPLFEEGLRRLRARRRGRRARSTSACRYRAVRTGRARRQSATASGASARPRRRKSLPSSRARFPWRASRSSAGSTTSLTSPPAALHPHRRSGPERHQRNDCGSPTSFGRNQALPASGTRPRRAKMKPILAPLAAIRISIGNVMVMPTPTAGAVDRRDRGLSAVEDRLDKPAAARVRAGKDTGAMLPDVSKLARAARHVGAGAEGAAGAGDDDGADIVVAVGAFKGIGDLGAHLAGIGIELVGPVERDDHEGAVELAADVFVVQASPPILVVLRPADRRRPLHPKNPRSEP